jgi:hypothetical protein
MQYEATAIRTSTTTTPTHAAYADRWKDEGIASAKAFQKPACTSGEE